MPVRAGIGKIVNKSFKPAGTYWQYPAGADRGFRTATPIPIAEAYVFEIGLEPDGRRIFYSLNTVASKDYEVGQNVQINYQERTIPFTGTRVYVVSMHKPGSVISQ